MLIASHAAFLRRWLVQWIWLIVATPGLAQNTKADVGPHAPAVELEAMTTLEVKEQLAAGTDTILIPIGGTEQSGPYIALGKHNFRVRYLAEKIAAKLGNALVAPVIAYVPEGSVSPPAAHMRFAGTISIPDAAFNAMLEGAARSFKQHGFHTIVFLGDHGGYRKNVEYVGQKLNREWAKEPAVRVISLTEYYRLSSAGFNAILKKQGFTAEEIGTHGGLADTSLIMAVDKSAVRSEAILHNAKPTARDGVFGDPHYATAELGQAGVRLIVDGSVAAIRAARQQ